MAIDCGVPGYEELDYAAREMPDMSSSDSLQQPGSSPLDIPAVDLVGEQMRRLMQGSAAEAEPQCAGSAGHVYDDRGCRTSASGCSLIGWQPSWPMVAIAAAAGVALGCISARAMMLRR